MATPQTSSLPLFPSTETSPLEEEALSEAASALLAWLDDQERRNAANEPLTPIPQKGAEQIAAYLRGRILRRFPRRLVKLRRPLSDQERALFSRHRFRSSDELARWMDQVHHLAIESGALESTGGAHECDC